MGPTVVYYDGKKEILDFTGVLTQHPLGGLLGPCGALDACTPCIWMSVMDVFTAGDCKVVSRSNVTCD